MSGIGVGKEILAYCGKCKMDLRATIIAMTGDRAARVECKTCNGSRAYKAPKGITEPGQVPEKKTRKKKAASKTTITVHEMWEKLNGEAEGAPIKDYSIRSNFTEGDVLQHKSFGRGFVTKVISAQKVEVCFQDDLKTLVQGR